MKIVSKTSNILTGGSLTEVVYREVLNIYHCLIKKDNFKTTTSTVFCVFSWSLISKLTSFFSVPADSGIKGRTASITEQLSQVRM